MNKSPEIKPAEPVAAIAFEREMVMSMVKDGFLKPVAIASVGSMPYGAIMFISPDIYDGMNEPGDGAGDTLWEQFKEFVTGYAEHVADKAVPGVSE